jgi:peptide/nickel transport system substrate-binding protein
MVDEANPKRNPIGAALALDQRARTIARRAAVRALGLIMLTVGLAAGAPAAAAPTGEVKIGLAAEPNTFDPHLTVGRNTQIFIVNVYDGLTARDAQGNLVPALAESWKRLNPTTWQFVLRKGVKFHNGDDFNAESVKFTLDRATNPETKATIASELSTIAGTEIVDPFTVNVVTKAPDFLLPVRLGELFGLMLSPKHTERRGQGSDRHQAERDRTVQAGHVVEERADGARGERELLARRPEGEEDHRAADLEDAARIAALQAGEVDLIAPIPHVGSASSSGTTSW